MWIPTEAIATAPAIPSAPAGLSAQKPPVSLGIPRLRNPPSTVPTGFPWLFLYVIPHVYPERAGIHKLPETSASPTRVSAAVTGMFHTLQSDTMGPRRTLPDSPPLQWILSVKTHSSLGKTSLHRSCAPSDYISLRQLCSQQRDRTSIWIYTRNISNSDKSHYDINSWITIYLTMIKNASLSHNSKHVRLL